MPPRGFTNPAPKTDSAREARKSFFCELCQKGYGRMNEFEAHEASYDHQHKKRLKDMKHMQRDPNATDKARRAERKADEKSGLITIKPVKLGAAAPATGARTAAAASAAGAGFKKGGFKSAFSGAAAVVKEEEGSGGEAGTGADARPVGGFRKVLGMQEDGETGRVKGEEDENMEIDTEDEGYEYYNPRRPTGCADDCPGIRI